MFISKKRFEELVKEKESLTTLSECQENAINEKDAQIKSLQILLEEANKINHAKANDNGCMIGEWCKQCRYGQLMRDDRSVWVRGISKRCYPTSDFKYIHNDLGYYCTKHMTEICPEFELPKN